jgi:hypothetical protein
MAVKTIIPVEKIQSRVHMIRKRKVHLDRDLTELYGIETRVLKQAVQNDKFMFELSDEEFEILRSQSGTSSYFKLSTKNIMKKTVYICTIILSVTVLLCFFYMRFPIGLKPSQDWELMTKFISTISGLMI